MKGRFFITFSNRPENYKKLSYLQKMSVINRKLRVGDVTKVAETTGFSTTHVSDVLSGKYENERIVNAAYDATRSRKSNPKRIQSLLNA